jgi:transposase InsO family protein
LLKLEGVSVSSPTVQSILIKHELGSKYERLLKLEEKHLQEGIELTAEQVKLIEKANPAFAERHVESSKPGELLGQDLFYVGQLKGVGEVYLDAVVDTFSSYAFGFLHAGKVPEASVAPLHNDVLPFHEDRELRVEAILTDNGREYCGTEAHPYELYLALSDIEHRKMTPRNPRRGTKVRHPYTNGFAERLHRTVLDEFFRTAFRTKLYGSVEELQVDLDGWLQHYNWERPHQGYRNLGQRPIDRIEQYLTSLNTVTEEA